ncbi:hypothetical protein N7333_02380 [Pseudomonas sp. GD04158]|uniref:hypothetical protein n=1 Tax=Pseudomonas sp. GD04158 TaxID=2975439 RepID=UPI00244BE5F2|nr:hypothetical protein [Pseudomonas sp. GD04158]MDH0095425.1 hypothetical protein [Pseudomonas sp. GD04158]
MKNFAKHHGFTLFHYVQEDSSPRYPYGVCGPFATAEEAQRAMTRVIAAFPTSHFHTEQGGWMGDCGKALSLDNAKARHRLARLRA